MFPSASASRSSHVLCFPYLVQVDIFKDPVTDHGKLSKKGRLSLELDEGGQLVTRTQGTGDSQKVAGWIYCSLPYAPFPHALIYV